MPTVPRASTNAASGQFALAADLGFDAVDLHGGLDDVDPAVDLRPITRCLIRSSGRIGARYSSANASHISLRGTSPPSPSVIFWITWLNFDLQPARAAHQAVVGLHDVGDRTPCLPDCGLIKDHGLVRAPDVLGVDRRMQPCHRMSSTSESASSAAIFIASGPC